MSTYVVLVNWAEQGIKQVREPTQRAARVPHRAEGLGRHMDILLWTLGRYDLVGVVDVP